MQQIIFLDEHPYIMVLFEQVSLLFLVSWYANLALYWKLTCQ